MQKKFSKMFLVFKIIAFELVAENLSIEMRIDVIARQPVKTQS